MVQRHGWAFVYSQEQIQKNSVIEIKSAVHWEYGSFGADSVMLTTRPNVTTISQEEGGLVRVVV